MVGVHRPAADLARARCTSAGNGKTWALGATSASNRAEQPARPPRTTRRARPWRVAVDRGRRQRQALLDLPARLGLDAARGRRRRAGRPSAGHPPPPPDQERRTRAGRGRSPGRARRRRRPSPASASTAARPSSSTPGSVASRPPRSPSQATRRPRRSAARRSVRSSRSVSPSGAAGSGPAITDSSRRDVGDRAAHRPGLAELGDEAGRRGTRPAAGAQPETRCRTPPGCAASPCSRCRRPPAASAAPAPRPLPRCCRRPCGWGRTGWWWCPTPGCSSASPVPAPGRWSSRRARRPAARMRATCGSSTCADPVAEHRRARDPRLAGHLGQVLDRHRDAVQRADRSPRASSSRSRSAASASTSSRSRRATTALTAGFSASMRSRWAATTSTQETSRAAIRRASSAAPNSTNAPSDTATALPTTTRQVVRGRGGRPRTTPAQHHTGTGARKRERTASERSYQPVTSFRRLHRSPRPDRSTDDRCRHR